MYEEELGAWAPLLKSETEKPYFTALMERTEAAYAESQVFPPRQDLFAAFRITPPQKVRAVIFGQDPYHEPGQAHGLAFSVREGTVLPPSLRNIRKELSSDTGLEPGESGDLTRWAEQGVLLLNTVLTVEQGKAGSHAGIGWETFTDAVTRVLAELPQPVAFVLWGAQAAKKEPVVLRGAGPRCVIRSPHPSPLSSYRGFFGSRPFTRINAYLEENGAEAIDWSL